jgi:hypothetical protein
LKQWWSIPELCGWAATRNDAAVDAVNDNDGEHFMGLDLLGDALLSDDDGAHVSAWKRHLAGTAGFPTRSDVVHERHSFSSAASLPSMGDGAAKAV